jgi:hypothetical protein
MSDKLDKDPTTDIVFDDAPRDLRPDLSLYGIEEVDRGVCEDSYENRSVLRAQRLNWQIVYSESGEPTGNILVLSPEMSSRRSEMGAEDRRTILTDDRNLNSDYLTEESLLIEETADSLVPLWVIAATRAWCRIREDRKTDPKKNSMIAGPPQRCRQIKSDGMRCLLWSANRTTDDELCRIHLGSRHNNITGAVARARERAYQAAPIAIQMLEQLMESAESEPVKLKAATEILDRAGIRGGVEIDAKVDVNIQPAAQLINERLLRLRPQASNILEIESSEDAGGGETVEEVILEVEPVELETVDSSNQEENN